MTAALATSAPFSSEGGVDWRAYIAKYDAQYPGALELPEGRRLLTRLDPLLFALVYMRPHITGKEGRLRGQITFSEFHTDLLEQARTWVRPPDDLMSERDVYVAPRDAGKSTWFFTIIPLWLAAHRHVNFIAAFAHSAEQAEQHLQTFKTELLTNDLLRRDYPDLVLPAKRNGGVVESDRRSMYISKSRFVFAAKGADTSVLGLKVGSQRPDLILLDDIEPKEEDYSPGQKDKRLGTLIDTIFPLNLAARVVGVGTVTMPGSIIHDCVKHAAGDPEAPEWVRDENLRVHHYKAIVEDADGAQRSVWPAKWSLEWLQSQAHKRSFRKNFMNDPLAADGEYWSEDDFRIGTVPGLTGQLLSIDPAVTATERSDYTALAVVGFNISLKQCLVRGAWQYRVQPGDALVAKVREILELYPETAGILIETNQGGDTWKKILGDLGLPIKTVWNGKAKHVRAAKLLNHYQHNRVLHEVRLPKLEEQMVAYPKVPNDDLIDAVGNGVEQFLSPPKRKTAGVTRTSYAA